MSNSKTKKIVIDEAMVKRVVRAYYTQDIKGKCLVCGSAFQDCPHSIGVVWQMIEIIVARHTFDIRI